MPREPTGPKNHVYTDQATNVSGALAGFIVGLWRQRTCSCMQELDPSGAATYSTNASAYVGRIDAMDKANVASIETIPAAIRKLVTFHDAFPYFAAAYGLTIDGTVVDAPGQDPSAGQIAALVSRIREGGVKAIFAEAQFNPDIVDTIAAETGATVVSDLYTDSVGDPPQETYEGLMRWNVERVVAALGG